MLNGIAPQQIVATLNMAMSDQAIATLNADEDQSQVGINLQLDEEVRSDIKSISGLKVISTRGQAFPISELITIENKPKREK